MFNLFKRRIPKELFHKDLPSRERITLVIEEFIEPALTDAGFTFKRRDLEFHRKRESGVREEIKLFTHRYNSKATGQAMFHPQVTLGYGPFDRFCTKVFGSKDPSTVWYGLPSELHGSTQDCLREGYYDLGEDDNRRIMEACKHNVVDVLLPRLNERSTPESLITFLGELPTPEVQTQLLLAAMNTDRQAAEIFFAQYEADCAKDKDPASRTARLERFRKIVEAVQ